MGTAVPESRQRGLNETALSRLPESIINAHILERLKRTSDGEACCAICHEDYEIGNSLLQLPCEHSFCSECGRQWLRQNNTCPICRTEVQNEPDEDDDGGWHSEDLFPYRFPQGSPLEAVRRTRQAHQS